MSQLLILTTADLGSLSRLRPGKTITLEVKLRCDYKTDVDAQGNQTPERIETEDLPYTMTATGTPGGVLLQAPRPRGENR